MSNSPAPKSKTASAIKVLSARIYKLYVPTSVKGLRRIREHVSALTGIAGGRTATSSYGAWIDADDRTVGEPVTCYEFVVTREQEAFHAAIISTLHALLDTGESCGMCTMQDGKSIRCITVS